MRATLAIVLAGAFGSFTAAQTQSFDASEPIATNPIASNAPPQGPGPTAIAGAPSPVPVPVPSGPGSAPSPIPIPSGAGPIPVPGPNNPVTAPQSSGQSAQSGVTVQIVPGPDGGVPMVATGSGAEQVQLVVGPNGQPVIPGPNGLIPVANIIGPNGQPLEPVDVPGPVPSGAPGPIPVPATSGAPLGAPGAEPLPVTPPTLNNPNAIPEPVPSGSAFPAPGATPVAPGQGPGGVPQGGYYNSGAGVVKVTAATFALAVVGVVALWI